MQSDVVGRYHKLREFYEKVAFEDEAEWSAKRLKWITPEKTER